MFAGAVERFKCAGGVALTSAIRKHGMTGSVEVGVRGLAGDRALLAEIASLSRLAPEWKQRLLVHHERCTHSTGTENRST